MDLEKLLAALPQEEQTPLRQLQEETALNRRPITICVAGTFSTGKTSLLNRMLKRPLLPVALEESTALPTFLSYSPAESFQIVATDAATRIGLEELEKTILKPPAGARFLDIGLPLNWLHNAQIVDLPGTGGVDPVKRDYARELMRQADAIIYLLAPRGPAAQDLETLKFLNLLGKKIFICVAQWDVVEEAHARGEKLPDLKTWAKEIEYNTGLRQALQPLDKNGLGIPEVINFIERAAADLANLRKARYLAELAPLLANLITAKNQALAAFAAKSAADSQAAHAALLAEKEQLLQIRAEVNRQRKEEIDSIMAEWDKESEAIGANLAFRLKEIAENWQDAAGQEEFNNMGRATLEKSLGDLASLGRDLSEKYGQLEIPKAEEQPESVALPPPPVLETRDFLDAGRFGLLQARLQDLEKAKENVPEAPDVDPEQIAALKAEISELETGRQTVMSQPLPRIREVEERGASGRAIGRMVGEIADLALLFLVPASIASKAGSYVGKTAKTLGMSAKMASTVGKAAKNVVATGKTIHNIGQGKHQLSQPIMEKLGMLDVITCGYWGERLGGMLDKPANVIERIDRDAERERDARLDELDREIQKRKLQLIDLERGAANSGNAQQLEAKILKINQEMEKLQKEAKEQASKATLSAQENYQHQLEFTKKRALQNWERVFNQQSHAMGDLLISLLRGWWDEHVPTLLAEQEERINTILAKMRASPQERAEYENNLKKQLAALEEAARSLKGAAA